MNAFRFGCLAAATAVVGLLSGCGEKSAEAEKPVEPTEAELFGYTGEDLSDQEAKTFLVTAPAVTNWVPERVLSVVEKYDFTPAETSLVAAIGILMPGASYAEIPSDYAKDSEEPWFVWWTKSAEAFGLKTGRTGILTHYDEEKRVWESNESYFSTYWSTREEAEQALATIRAEIEKNYGVKKFHDISNGWIAEYVRLCVMGVVGQKPDGSWSCMLDLRDKCSLGCGPWEPVEEQQERRDQYEYAKAMRAWKAEVAEAQAKNRELIDKGMKELGLAGFEDAAVAGTAENGQSVFVVGGAGEEQKTDAAMDEAFTALWSARADALVKALGVTAVQAEPDKRDFPGQGAYWCQVFRSPLFEARLEAFKPLVPATPAEAPQAEGEEGEPAPEPPAVAPQWRILYTELLQPGVTMPQKPQLKK